MNVRVGIIGFGNMGRAHAHCIANGDVDGLSLCAVCDIDEKKRDEIRQAYPDIAVFADSDELILSGSVDAVIIATPHYFHPPIAIAAFNAGLHVLTEKPAGVEAAEARKMNLAAEKSGKVFAIMFNQRTNPLFIRARQLVRSGELGELKRLNWIVTNWYRTQAYYDSGSWRATWAGEGGGVLLNQAPHNLDIWQWIFGMPSKIRAFCTVAKWHNIEVEDDATIYAEYENGAVATFVTSTGEYPGTNRLEISGDLGKIVLEDGKLRHWRLKEPERKLCFSCEKGFATFDTEYEEYIPTEEESAHRGILQNFTNAILHGEKLISPGYEGINELTVSNAAYLSSWLGDTVTLPFDEVLFSAELRKRQEQSHICNDDTEKNADDGYRTRWKVRW